MRPLRLFHASYASLSPSNLSAQLPPRSPPHPTPTRQPRAKTLRTINQPLATAGRDGVTLSSVCRRIERPCPRVTLTLPIWHPWYLLAALKIEKIHKSLKWAESKFGLSAISLFSNHCGGVFSHSFLSMSNHCPLQPPLFGGSRRENVVLMLSGDQSSVKQEAENDNVLFWKTKREVWAKIGFWCRLSSMMGSQRRVESTKPGKKNTHARTFAQTS